MLYRRQYRRALVLLVMTFIVIDTYNLFKLEYIEPLPLSYVNSEKIYIAAIHWNSEAILKDYWNNAVIELVNILGNNNVYVDIYESGSWDNTKEVLQDLEKTLERLNIRKNITLSSTTHLDIIASNNKHDLVSLPGRDPKIRRIPHLANARNIALDNLYRMVQEGNHFDKIIFLNDIVFTPSDILMLLDTNNGHYAASCALDFKEPSKVYDTFALRDIEGHKMLTQTWPYFKSSKSRNSLLIKEAVPVTSCWNGATVMAIGPFISSPKLRFRAIDNSLANLHLEASECCLIHADNPLTASSGVYINPNVRVAYSGDVYDKIHTEITILSQLQKIIYMWDNRLSRITSLINFVEYRTRSKIDIWNLSNSSNKKESKLCIIDETQILVGNGWAHI